jgi:hypothetical protein
MAARKASRMIAMAAEKMAATLVEMMVGMVAATVAWWSTCWLGPRSYRGRSCRRYRRRRCRSYRPRGADVAVDGREAVGDAGDAAVAAEGVAAS